MFAFIVTLAAAATPAPSQPQRPGFEPYRACIAKTLTGAAAAATTPEDLGGTLGRSCIAERDAFRTTYRAYLETLRGHPAAAEMDGAVQDEIDDLLGRALSAYLVFDRTGDWPAGWP